MGSGAKLIMGLAAVFLAAGLLSKITFNKPPNADELGPMMQQAGWGAGYVRIPRDESGHKVAIIMPGQACRPVLAYERPLGKGPRFALVAIEAEGGPQSGTVTFGELPDEFSAPNITPGQFGEAVKANKPTNAKLAALCK